MSASSFYTALSTFDRSGVGFSLGDIDDVFVGHTSKRYKKNHQGYRTSTASQRSSDRSCNNLLLLRITPKVSRFPLPSTRQDTRSITAGLARMSTPNSDFSVHLNNV